MSKYDYPDLDAPPKQTTAARIELWDMLSILVLLITACMGVYFLMIFINPFSSLNPLKPFNSDLPPTMTPTPLQLEPTWTASPTIQPTITETARPTFTPLASPTFFSLVPATNTPEPTRTPKATDTPKAPFSASVTAIDSTIIHPESACNWMGVGGTVVDSNNSDVIGIVIRLVGTLNGKRVEMTQVSGVTPAYGKSGFEFFLGTVPVASKGTLYVQLLDLAGLPLSQNVYVDTFNDCSKNLVLVRFKKNR
jgi:hypothetical protein